ncbi:MAG TPA: acyl-CoA dehydrogenase [Streptomyces sp.]|uniref:acyl-CoA dehydrogenase family protein n=1 Tax=Streptomyces sp. TaxID=1931 RepID=UPI002D30425A|nr:acyl-CoA dehydrogenase [Streptomyces sp.]HZG04697.1 acyl-CoA dehydrogenase [Streptomyces sp.]
MSDPAVLLSPGSVREPRTDSGPDITADTGGREVWAALGAAGRIAAVFRDGDPAAGVDPARLGELLADVDARTGIGSTLAVSVQIATAVPLLTLARGQDQEPALRAERQALAGTAVVALAATDETAGSDLAGLRTELRIGEAELELNGTKRWITNATQADYFLVLARHRPGRHFTNFTWVLVPASAPGITVERADTELFDGSGTGHIRFDAVRLPRDHLVGRPGRALASFAAHIAVERLAGALWGIALCRRVLADTKRRLEARPTADGTLWQAEAVRQRFGRCLVLVRQLQALTRELGEPVARRHDATSAALLKSSVALTLEEVLAECAHFQGAEGFSGTGAQRLRPQAALFGIGGGSTEVVLSIVAGAADTVLAELSP